MYFHEFLIRLIVTLAIVIVLMQVGERVFDYLNRKKQGILRKEFFAIIFSLTVLYGTLQMFTVSVSFLYFLCAILIILLNKARFHWAPDKIS